MDNKVYIAFYLGRKKDNPKTSILDRVICFFTNSRYSHCELVIDLDEDSKTGVCWSSSIRDGGVRKKTIRFDDHWEVYELETISSPEYFDQWFEKENGKKYDLFGAIGVTFPIFKHDNRRWFCSEIIAASWGLENVQRYSPQDLFDFFIYNKQRITFDDNST